ncbi:MAG TPA: pseudaminic acid cytidylyltransferase [Gammaproteobacteria bacterium]|nr:pseudaminic acid cytidylyltransferase [Gammaproteobacteria bacterium]
MGNIALIPARGGSKRLPRKNIIDFLGKPIISYTIEAALQSNCFDRVVVSTDDMEIASVAEQYGAEVDIRNDSLATDTSTVVDVCIDYLGKEAEKGNQYDILCVLYATAPLRTAEDIRQLISLIEPVECEFSIAVTDYDVPPHQALKLVGDLNLVPMWPELINARSESIGELRVDNGSTYAVTVPAFLKARSFYGPTLRGYYMPHSRSVDIDTPNDYELARHYAELNNR